MAIIGKEEEKKITHLNMFDRVCVEISNNNKHCYYVRNVIECGWHRKFNN